LEAFGFKRKEGTIGRDWRRLHQATKMTGKSYKAIRDSSRETDGGKKYKHHRDAPPRGQLPRPGWARGVRGTGCLHGDHKSHHNVWGSGAPLLRRTRHTREAAEMGERGQTQEEHGAFLRNRAPDERCKGVRHSDFTSLQS